VFFNTGLRSLALDKNSADLFSPITANTIWLICVAIRHALEDYRSGIRIIYKFEANATVTDSWERLRNTWKSYQPERDERLRRLLLQQVNKMRNVTRDKMPQTQQAIRDPFKDTTEDLEELDPKYDDGFTQRPHTDNGSPAHSSPRMSPETTYEVSFSQYTDETILMPYDYDINAIKALLKQIHGDNEQETGIDRRILRCTFAGESEVIDITDSAVLEDIKARLRSGGGRVTLEFADEEDESREGSGIDGENDSDEEDESREGSGIDGENDGENEDD